MITNDTGEVRQVRGKWWERETRTLVLGIMSADTGSRKTHAGIVGIYAALRRLPACDKSQVDCRFIHKRAGLHITHNAAKRDYDPTIANRFRDRPSLPRWANRTQEPRVNAHGTSTH